MKHIAVTSRDHSNSRGRPLCACRRALINARNGIQNANVFGGIASYEINGGRRRAVSTIVGAIDPRQWVVNLQRAANVGEVRFDLLDTGHEIDQQSPLVVDQVARLRNGCS